MLSSGSILNKANKFELIQFHPNINSQDYEKLESLQSQHTLDICLSMVLLGLMTNKLLSFKLRSRIVRYPISLAISSCAVFTFTRHISKFVPDFFLYREIKQLSLDKYLGFSYDECVLKKELEDIGVKIKPKYL